jgi:hypothetical protein
MARAASSRDSHMMLNSKQQTSNDWPSANGAGWTMRHGRVQMLGPDAWAPLNALLDLFELCAVRSRDLDLVANAEPRPAKDVDDGGWLRFQR